MRRRPNRVRAEVLVVPRVLPRRADQGLARLRRGVQRAHHRTGHAAGRVLFAVAYRHAAAARRFPQRRPDPRHRRSRQRVRRAQALVEVHVLQRLGVDPVLVRLDASVGNVAPGFDAKVIRKLRDSEHHLRRRAALRNGEHVVDHGVHLDVLDVQGRERVASRGRRAEEGVHRGQTEAKFRVVGARGNALLRDSRRREKRRRRLRQGTVAYVRVAPCPRRDRGVARRLRAQRLHREERRRVRRGRLARIRPGEGTLTSPIQLHRDRRASAAFAAPEARTREPERRVAVARGDAPRAAAPPELRGDRVRGDDSAQMALRFLPFSFRLGRRLLRGVDESVAKLPRRARVRPANRVAVRPQIPRAARPVPEVPPVRHHRVPDLRFVIPELRRSPREFRPEEVRPAADRRRAPERVRREAKTLRRLPPPLDRLGFFRRVRVAADGHSNE
mmetsp:Transcript_12101/g.52143  ORF Transcript_12101/g.52143 Transcript_12101/m.52143 type:complete len:445 (+) Transcript_12101:103-1437(+)